MNFSYKAKHLMKIAYNLSCGNDLPELLQASHSFRAYAARAKAKSSLLATIGFQVF